MATLSNSSLLDATNSAPITNITHTGNLISSYQRLGVTYTIHYTSGVYGRITSITTGVLNNGTVNQILYDSNGNITSTVIVPWTTGVAL